MELLACIEAIEFICGRRSPITNRSQYTRILIKTDSMYVVDNYPNAMFTWPKTRWRTKDGAPVANADLWKQLIKAVRNATPRRVDIEWVKGHRASTHNKAADKLAKSSAKGQPAPSYGQSSSRNKSSESVERGSVKLTGQRLTIRIIEDEYLRVQRCYKYRYEVMSKASPYFQKVDFAYAPFLLRAGHTYFVRMGTDTRNPEIAKCFREVGKTAAVVG